MTYQIFLKIFKSYKSFSFTGKGPQGESSNPKPDMHEKYKNMHECIKKLLDEE